MRAARPAVAGLAMGLAVGLATLVVRGQDAPAGDYADVARPFVANHCLQCHRGPKAKGKFRLDLLAPADAPSRDLAGWATVRRMLANREMPPKQVTPPSADEYGAVLAWIDRQLAAWRAAIPVDPGRVTIRRLNRAEYANTVRDLLGVTFHADETFPADDVGYGFDNIGDVLSLPPILLEKYLAAAERIAAAAIVERDPAEPARHRLAASDLTLTGKGNERGGVSVLYTEGEWHGTFEFRRDGLYLAQARAFGQQAGPDVCRAEFRLDGRAVGAVEVPATADAPAIYEARFRVTAGTRRLGVAFVNDFYEPSHPDPRQRDRNLGLYHLELIGPIDPQELPATQTRWLPNPGATLVDAVRALALSAFRRPPSAEELTGLVAVAERGAGPDASVERRFRTAVTAVLVSPHFLYRAELHSAPDDQRTVRPLPPHALASRLSYFLWSSMPDERLFELAASGALTEPATLAAEAERMLRDPRAGALAEHFAPQWLQVRALAEATPDPGTFPEFDDALREAMRLETQMFFDAVLREDRPVGELLASDFTFVNERLARHYGIPGVRGPHMRRVALGGLRQGGVLAHGSVLTVTSNPTRTSPVRRGKWGLSALLDQPPPAPPPGFDSFDERPAMVAGSTLRERLERHRADPKCSVCHLRMDAMGFALEPYDPIGRPRARDGQFLIDAKGTLPDGRVVDGPAGLATLLRDDPAFLRSLSRHLLTYALGRGLAPTDEPALDACVAALREEPTLRRLVRTIVQLEAFRLHRGEARSEGF